MVQLAYDLEIFLKRYLVKVQSDAEVGFAFSGFD